MSSQPDLACPGPASSPPPERCLRLAANVNTTTTASHLPSPVSSSTSLSSEAASANSDESVRARLVTTPPVERRERKGEKEQSWKKQMEATMERLSANIMDWTSQAAQKRDDRIATVTALLGPERTMQLQKLTGSSLEPEELFELYGSLHDIGLFHSSSVSKSIKDKLVGLGRDGLVALCVYHMLSSTAELSPVTVLLVSPEMSPTGELQSADQHSHLAYLPHVLEKMLNDGRSTRKAGIFTKDRRWNLEEGRQALQVGSLMLRKLVVAELAQAGLDIDGAVIPVEVLLHLCGPLRHSDAHVHARSRRVGDTLRFLEKRLVDDMGHPASIMVGLKTSMDLAARNKTSSKSRILFFADDDELIAPTSPRAPTDSLNSSLNSQPSADSNPDRFRGIADDPATFKLYMDRYKVVEPVGNRPARLTSEQKRAAKVKTASPAGTLPGEA